MFLKYSLHDVYIDGYIYLSEILHGDPILWGLYYGDLILYLLARIFYSATNQDQTVEDDHRCALGWFILKAEAEKSSGKFRLQCVPHQNFSGKYAFQLIFFAKCDWGVIVVDNF